MSKKKSPDFAKGFAAARAIVANRVASACAELAAAEKAWRKAAMDQRKTREVLIAAKAKLAAFEEAMKLAESEETKDN